jgi:hypothetical protein
LKWERAKFGIFEKFPIVQETRGQNCDFGIPIVSETGDLPCLWLPVVLKATGQLEKVEQLKGENIWLQWKKN